MHFCNVLIEKEALDSALKQQSIPVTVGEFAIDFLLCMPRGGATAYVVHLCVCVCLLLACCLAHSKLSADTSNTGRNQYLLGTELIDV